MSEEEVPVKIFRHVLKGLQFFHAVDASGCTFNELISFVFLKNERVYQPALVRKWVEQVLSAFGRCRLLRDDPFGNYCLHGALLNHPLENDEHYMLNPNQNAPHNMGNTSEESLSTVPHYQRVLNRKGTNYTLTKHRQHGNA